jgi:UDP-3-O-[3-hydroxymyristoyl] glucosamine N-acyltransferase
MMTAAQIHELSTDALSFVQGPLNAKVYKILPPENASAESLVFVSNAEQLEVALKHNASIVVAYKNVKIPEKSHAAFFTTPHVQLAMATLGPFFDKKIQRYQQETHIHPKSCIHPSAKLGKNVIVGPFAVLGAEVQIGDHCIIGANTVIQDHVRIGAHSLIHPLVFIGGQCEIGAYCELHPHCSIGADGFSFVPLKGSHPVKVPQLGRVVLGDHVEIGAGCTIDRAALTETRIDSGTKLDNLCHIGHNCHLGENNLTAAGFMMAGSVKTGKNFIGGGRTVVTDHVTITDNVMVGGFSAVTKDITEPGQYAGYPLQSVKDSLKTLTTSLQLPMMRKQLRRIMKHLNLSEED